MEEKGKPVVAQKSPYAIQMEPGTYAWCSCGKSSKQPFCDGQHTGSEFKPVIENITETKTVYWCGCKNSKSGAFCDGNHKNITE